MTITRREKPVPTRLPSARLYLDDIEEITRILVDAGDGLLVEPGKPAVEIRFEVGDQICDDLQELPKITRRAVDFELKLACKQCGYTARLGVTPSIGWQWTTTGLPKETAWRVFHKLECVIAGRRPHLLLRQTPWWVPIFFWGLVVVIFNVTTLGKIKVGLNLTTLAVAAGVFLALAYVTLRRRYGQSAAIFRHYLDEDSMRREYAWKLIPPVLTFVLGLIGGIILTYLKHRYWP